MDLAVVKHNHCNRSDSCFLLLICTYEKELHKLEPKAARKVEPNTKLLLPLSGSALVYQRDHLVFGHQKHKERNQKY